MKLLSLEPESSASANSAISAEVVGRDGFEPSKAEPADLQSAPFGHSGTYPFLDNVRILSHAYSGVNPLFSVFFQAGLGMN